MVFRRLRRAGRRAFRIGRGAVRATGRGIRAVSGVVRKIDDAMNSPVGQVALTMLKANPKTAAVATKMEMGISQGREIGDIAEGLTRGEKQAFEQAIDRATRQMNQ